jgi:hypothetical protein
MQPVLAPPITDANSLIRLATHSSSRKFLMPQVVGSPKLYDVCIIGSGAGGGPAADGLTEGGLNLVMLAAGRPETLAGNFVRLRKDCQRVVRLWRSNGS